MERLLKNFNSNVLFKFVTSLHRLKICNTLFRSSFVIILKLFSFPSLKCDLIDEHTPVALKLVDGTILLGKYFLRLLN